jgi:hypothetical protein
MGRETRQTETKRHSLLLCSTELLKNGCWELFLFRPEEVAQVVENLTTGSKIEGLNHRDKTRVQMPAKMFPHLKLLCWLFMGPTHGFATMQRNSFLIKFGVLYNKSKF